MRTATQLPADGISRFAGTLIDLLDRVEYRRVSIENEFDPVYRLRYEAYRREEFIPSNMQSITRDEYDLADNCYCFGVYIDDELVRLNPVPSCYADQSDIAGAVGMA
ncbi:hypothetical protein PSQ19_13240 [Devosia algicola]|uniref:N-acyl amino acid synthase FeeM catalytic core domain-containing protein n=1 Tax=Devosia algicola TaxID=3026418 RepID=A0ABY7YK97_9HYPH|nr:hypothetical protein [Devosia algicola]WDR01706.1 hypothetical protein PSQ19_13240 [Devosia algicola]